MAQTRSSIRQCMRKYYIFCKSMINANGEKGSVKKGDRKSQPALVGTYGSINHRQHQLTWTKGGAMRILSPSTFGIYWPAFRVHTSLPGKFGTIPLPR